METIASRKQKAIKDHKCDWCNLPIKKGEVYNYSVYKADNDLYVWKNHISCAEIAEKLKMFEDVWDKGLTGEDFQECIENEYSKLMMITDGDDDESPPFEYKLNFVKNKFLEPKL